MIMTPMVDIERERLLSVPEFGESKVTMRKQTNNKSTKMMRRYYLTACGIGVLVLVIIYGLINRMNEINSGLNDQGHGGRSASNFLLPSDIRKLRKLEISSKQDNINNGSLLLSNYDIYDELEKFQLDLNHCKISKVPLNSQNLKRNQRTWNFISCQQQQPMSAFDKNGKFVLTNKNKNCCYQAISRNVNMVQDRYSISDDCIPLAEYNSKNKIKDEYFQIKCTLQDKKEDSMEFHGTVQLTPERIQKKIQFWDLNHPQESNRPPNVLMLAIDASSRTSLYRHLPKTASLLKQMDFMDFTGHHALGEPTFPNAIGLLFGTQSASFWKYNKTSWTSRWDEYPFIWKEFHKLNYLTFFMEDEQNLGTFQYSQQTGFRNQPTDICPRPLLLAKEKYFMHRNDEKKKLCFGDQLMPDYLLNYQRSFLEKTKSYPSFSLSWLTWPQHDFMEKMPELDSPISNFLSSLSKDKDLLENTVVIILSDHSSWNSPYSRTMEGLLERRLPFLFIRYPKKLNNPFMGAEQFTNLQNNQHRITTHYDTHQTLLHIAQMAATLSNQTLTTTKPKFGLSLLDTIPIGRTCNEANIPIHMCACDLILPNPEKKKSVNSFIEKLQFPNPGPIMLSH